MITDKKLLYVYEAFRRKVGSSCNYKAHLAELPEELRTILTENSKLMPFHCDTSVIKEFYIEILKAIQPAYLLDEYTTPTVELISQRIAKSDEFERQSPYYGLDKGIMLLGGIGSGKTLLMEGLSKLYHFFEIEISLLPSYMITEEFARKGVEVYCSVNYKSDQIWTSADNMIIDDFGAETITKHYGQVTNVVAELMLRRYDNKVQTYGTSNLDQKSLRKFYGERVWSRMKEMFNFIELKGDDRRG